MMLNTLHNWTRDWMLSVNIDKTKIIHFRKARMERTQIEFTLGAHNIDIATEYRYLGLDFNETFDPVHGVSKLCTSASRAIGKIVSKYYSIDGISHTVFKHMFESFVVPIMDYASPIWGTRRYDGCAVIQNRAMRTFLGVGKCAPLPAIYNDMQWNSAFVRQQASAVRYFMRLTRMPNTRLTRHIFEWDYSLALSGRKSWCRDIQVILRKCDMGHLFDRQHWHDNSVNGTHYATLTRLSEIESQQNRLAGETMSRLRHYNAVSAVPIEHNGAQPYLQLDRRQRAVVAKLRTGTLPLAIETGRYRRIAREQRLCLSCERSVIEDELHFLFHCEKYSDIRRHTITPLRDNEPIDTLARILNDKQKCRNLANFIIKALQSRVH